MSQVAQEFLYKLIVNGKSEKDATKILSDIITNSLLELYREKKLNEEQEQQLDKTLKYLQNIGASKRQIISTLGISPTDLEIKLKEKIRNYQYL